MTDELTVSASRSAVAPAYESPRSRIRNGRSAGTAPWQRSLDMCPAAIATSARRSARTAAGRAWASVAMAAHGTERGAVNLTSTHQPSALRPHPIHASMPAMKFESVSPFSSSSAAAVSAAVAAPAAHTAGNASATRPTAASSPHTR